MSIIQKELDAERRKPNNKQKINFYESILKKGYITKADFSISGRAVFKESYLRRNPGVKLDKDCTKVLIYIGGYIIQNTSDGRFIVEDSQCRSLAEMEKELWDKVKYNYGLRV